MSECCNGGCGCSDDMYEYPAVPGASYTVAVDGVSMEVPAAYVLSPCDGKSRHQELVEKFRVLAGQPVPESPTMPDAEGRLLQARLIFEEAMETINKGLGVSIRYPGSVIEVGMENAVFSADREPDLEELADGCGDLSVVTTSTLSAAGIDDIPVLHTIDEANLKKFGPGGYRDAETNKWIKPPDFVPPNIKQILIEQGWNVEGQEN